MRHPFALLLAPALAASLTGCLTIGAQALSTNGLAPLTQTVNAARGSDFSDRMLLTGASIGVEVPGGILGIAASGVRGTQRSTDATGQEVTLSAEVSDVTTYLGYPVRSTSRTTVVLGGQWTIRSTQAAGGEGTSFTIGPRVGVASKFGRFALSAHATYDLPVIEDEKLFESRGTPVRAGLRGVRGGLGISYNFGLNLFDWFE